MPPSSRNKTRACKHCGSEFADKDKLRIHQATCVKEIMTQQVGGTRLGPARGDGFLVVCNSWAWGVPFPLPLLYDVFESLEPSSDTVPTLAGNLGDKRIKPGVFARFYAKQRQAKARVHARANETAARH